MKARKSADPAGQRGRGQTSHISTGSIAHDTEIHEPKELARLASYRSAAQAIRRQDAPLGERGDRMIALAQQARAESDPWTRDLAQQIVWAQAEWMLEGEEALRKNQMRGRIEMAARKLRLQGYERCYTCEQRLSDPSDWTFWSALRQAEVDRLNALDRELVHNGGGGEAA